MNQSSLNRLAVMIALALVVAFAGATTARPAAEPAVPVRMVHPEYPYELKREGVTGVVTLVFDVDETGTVQDAKVQKSSNPKFEQPALDAIAKWKFKPARKDGVPVRTKVAIPLQFTINE
jgi:protein TonB